MRTALSTTSTTISSDQAPAAGLLAGRLDQVRKRSVASNVPDVRLRINRTSAFRSTRSSCDVEPAIEGNHVAIQAFLQRTLYRPDIAEFASAVQRPGYDPSERLIARHPADRSLVAHVQLQSQTIRFGQTTLPTVRLRDLAVLPEYQGIADDVLRAAESVAKQRGAMLMVARGEDVALLKRHGWTALGSDPVCVVSPQRMLGQLPTSRSPSESDSPFYDQRVPTSNVRIGRLTDVDSLQVMYEHRHATTTGTPERSAETWSWLVARHAHDRMYVFTEDGQDLAYVVVRGGRVLELVDLTNDDRGAARLLAQVAADAIDQGRHSLHIHAPLTDVVHQWADAAGGQAFAAVANDVWMVKCLSIRTLLRRLAHEMFRRRPRGMAALNLQIDDEQLLIRAGVRSMKVTRGSLGTHRITLTHQAAMRLFVGHRSVRELAAEGELFASDDQALSTAQELFPTLTSWRTHWDDVCV